MGTIAIAISDSNRRGICAHQAIEIFLPALPHRGERAVHADADNSLAAAEPDAVAGLFYAFGESYVFEDFGGDGGVAADGVVGFARD